MTDRATYRLASVSDAGVDVAMSVAMLAGTHRPARVSAHDAQAHAEMMAPAATGAHVA